MRVVFGGDPQPERRLYSFPSDDGVEQLVHVVKSEMTVVQ